MPAEETSSVHSPRIGSSTSSTAPTAWLIASQSSTRKGVAIGAVGHDLHHRPFLAADLHAHELVAHVLDGGGDGVGDARLQPLVLRTFDAARHGHGPESTAQKRKRRPPGGPPSEDRMVLLLAADIGGAAAPGKRRPRRARFLRRRLRRPHRPRQVPRREGLRDVVRERVGHRLLRLPALQQQDAELGQRRQALAGPKARRPGGSQDAGPTATASPASAGAKVPVCVAER